MQIRMMFYLSMMLFGLALLWWVSSLPDFQLLGKLVHRVETQQPILALTFDDGPTPEKTEQILQILDQEQVSATFFLTGSHIERHPELLQKIIEEGHQVGNRSYSAQRMMFKSAEFIAQEIEQTDALLRKSGAPEPYLFRPPFGKKFLVLPSYLAKTQRTSVTWDIAPEHFAALAQDPALLVKYVTDNAKAGSIILLHVMQENSSASMQAVPAMIRNLKQKGFRFVTVGELIHHQSDQLQHAKWSNVMAPLR